MKQSLNHYDDKYETIIEMENGDLSSKCFLDDECVSVKVTINDEQNVEKGNNKLMKFGLGGWMYNKIINISNSKNANLSNV